jgi:hypothetical protein
VLGQGCASGLLSEVEGLLVGVPGLLTEGQLGVEEVGFTLGELVLKKEQALQLGLEVQRGQRMQGFERGEVEGEFQEGGMRRDWRD